MYKHDDDGMVIFNQFKILMWNGVVYVIGLNVNSKYFSYQFIELLLNFQFKKNSKLNNSKTLNLKTIKSTS
jgi:hypothetical protein